MGEARGEGEGVHKKRALPQEQDESSANEI